MRLAQRNDQKGFSIVIPTFGRVTYLKQLLETLQVSIERFSLPTEIIIVDSTPSPENTLIRALANNFGCRYFYAHNAVSLKRNIGIRNARYPAILFLDSDCEVSPDILAEHWKCLNSGEDVGGCLGLLLFRGRNHWFWNVIELTPYVLPFYWPLYEKEVPWGPTANISFWKHALIEVGEFDESFPPWPGGEDVDLGLRVTKNGYRILTNAKAKAFHTKETWLGWRKMTKRLYRWGQADYYLYLRHKDRIFFQLPRDTVVFMVVGISAIVLSLLKQSGLFVAYAILFFVSTLFLQSLFQHMRFGVGKNSSLLKQLVGILLSLSDELGFILLALKNLDIKALFLKMRYTDGQQIGEWHYGSVRMWSMILSFVLTMMGILLSRGI